MLDGAEALCLPLPCFTQALQIETNSTAAAPHIHWRSYDHREELWFEGRFDHRGVAIEATDADVAHTLEKMFKISLIQNSMCLHTPVIATTTMNFNRQWGLGTSSTLICNLAQWTGVDRYRYLDGMPGSGYDLASADRASPFIYQLTPKERKVEPVEIKWKFSEYLYFVYLNQKVNSRSSVSSHHSAREAPNDEIISRMTTLTRELVRAGTLSEFEQILSRHEEILSALLRRPTIQSELFSSYPYVVKSLGAWGGDFCMLTTRSPDDLLYFRKLGYNQIFSFDEMTRGLHF